MSVDASPADPFRVTDITTLEALYGEPGEASLRKESPGEMLHALTHAEIDGVAYDRDLPERVKTTFY